MVIDHFAEVSSSTDVEPHEILLLSAGWDEQATGNDELLG